MTTIQIVLLCWLTYGVGFVTGWLFKYMMDKDEPLTSELLVEKGDCNENSN